MSRACLVPSSACGAGLVALAPAEAARDPLMRSTIRRRFSGYWYTGRVVSIDVDAYTRERAYHIVYEDGDEEHLSQFEVQRSLVSGACNAPRQFRVNSAQAVFGQGPDQSQHRSLGSAVLCGPGYVFAAVTILLVVWSAPPFEHTSFDRAEAALEPLFAEIGDLGALPRGAQLPVLSEVVAHLTEPTATATFQFTAGSEVDFETQDVHDRHEFAMQRFEPESVQQYFSREPSSVPTWPREVRSAEAEQAVEGASSERAALGESPFLSNRFAHHDEWRSPPEDLYERNDFQMLEHRQGVLLEFLTSFLSKRANVQIPGGLTVSCQDLAAVVLVVVGLLTMAISVGAGCSSSKTGPGVTCDAVDVREASPVVSCDDRFDAVPWVGSPGGSETFHQEVQKENLCTPLLPLIGNDSKDQSPERFSRQLTVPCGNAGRIPGAGCWSPNMPKFFQLDTTPVGKNSSIVKAPLQDASSRTLNVGQSRQGKRFRYLRQLRKMQDMGYDDCPELRELLTRHGGDVGTALQNITPW